MGVACPACGTGLRTDAKFCDECGASLARASSAEYKQVTILFADVVHSMDIAAAVGPERLREIMSELCDRCAAVVQRYGGTVNQFTGDGIMAVFGAPTALEDHAIRACLAATDIQQRVRDLAADVTKRDAIDLQLRIGLNSGEVIAGEVGSRAHSYTTIGDQVGMAQRMESAAPPGGITLSESTARLVENQAVLSERRPVGIKGADDPVPACELLSIAGRHPEIPSRTASFVGRDWELTALSAMLDRATNGHGCVAGIVGPPGIGKSRIVAETAKLAMERGLPVFSTYCESHTTDVAFQATTRLLRSAWRVDGLEGDVARDTARSRVPGANPQDLILLFDELGIRDPNEPLPDIAPDARRRRLTALVNASVVAREEPVVYVIEDAHWVDSASEALLAEFLSVIPRAPALVLITYRPEYTGALSRSPGSQTIALEPLDDSLMTGLVNELLGADPSVAELTGRIAEHASGNPFFAQEIVRDLSDRGVLQGDRGRYTCVHDVADVNVPATVQAAIAARVDRLASDAKATLNAASVIGLRFDEHLLAVLADNTAVEPLLKAELIDQVVFTPRAEYVFRHPLIRSVAYRSQLATHRAQLHRRLAGALEARDPTSADDNAALIAEHLETAGDLAPAFGWHMRAAEWLRMRDIDASYRSWRRARDVADRMPADQPGRDAMRLGPRALMCANAFRTTTRYDERLFEEACRLADAAGDKISSAIALSGRVSALTFRGNYRDASRIAAEVLSRLEAVGDPDFELTLLPAVMLPLARAADLTEFGRLVERIIELAEGDPRRGAAVIESPLALAMMFRAVVRMSRGIKGWQGDMKRGVEMMAEFAPIGYAVMMFWKYGYGVAAGAVRADDTAVQETSEILEVARRTGDNLAVDFATAVHGFVLAQQKGPERHRGIALLAGAREGVMQERSITVIQPFLEIDLAKERARNGDVEGAVDALRILLDNAFDSGGLGPHAFAVEALVEVLLGRRRPADVAGAREAIDRLTAMPRNPDLVIYDVALLRLRALLARASGDEAEYRAYRDKYRTMAHQVGFEGHIAMADAMP